MSDRIVGGCVCGHTEEEHDGACGVCMCPAFNLDTRIDWYCQDGYPMALQPRPAISYPPRNLRK